LQRFNAFTHPLCVHGGYPPAAFVRRLQSIVKRHITDSQGRRWDVWEVDPRDLNRFAYDRRGSGRDERVDTLAAAVHPELSEGWICFQSGEERRRFAPIPPGWIGLPDSVLRVMLDVATPVARTSGAANRPVGE
jgi:hypothetical protein